MNNSSTQTGMGKFNIATFFCWWIRSLLECLPAPVAKLFEAKHDIILFEPTRSGVKISQHIEGEENSVGSFSLNADLKSSLPNGFDEIQHDIVLRFPANKVLSINLELPGAAGDNLAQVLAMQMDVNTPFTADNVYFDYLIKERTAEKINLELFIITRKVMHEWIKRIQEWGFQLAKVDVDKEITINLLPLSERPKVSQRNKWLNLGLFLVSIVLLLTLALVPLWQKRAETIAWQTKADELARQSKKVLKLQKKISNTTSISDFIIHKKIAAPGVIPMLNELTIMFPDNTFAQQFEVKNGGVRVRGESSKASALIGLMEHSKFFRNVKFLSPVTQNPGTGKERYHIGAEIIVKEDESKKKSKAKNSKSKSRRKS